MKPRILIGLAVMLALSACREDMQSFERGNPAAARRVLIAGNASEFRLKVVSAAMAELGDGAYIFKLTGLDGLANEDAGRYEAILLVDEVQGNRLDQRAARYLKRVPADPKVILFFTRGGGSARPAGLDDRIDALAAASSAEQIGEKARRLAALIAARFKPAL